MTAPGNIQAIYPLTAVQDGILFHTLYAPESPLYIQQYSAELVGKLDVGTYQRAWSEVALRHEALRSLLTWQDRNRPLHIVRTESPAEWTIEDWSEIPESETSEALEGWLERDRKRGFDLEAAPLMRFALFKLSGERHRLVWTHHHVMLDGWSLGIVLDEVDQTYAAFTSGQIPDLAPPAAYRSYVQWLQAQDHAPQERYWRKQLAGFSAATALPIEKPGSTNRWAESHGEHIAALSATATTELRNAVRDAGATLSTALRAAWALVLSRYSGDGDVLFGATVAGRPPELEGALEMVGMFINTLPVRVDVPEELEVRSWLRDLQTQQLEMAEYEASPLVDVQRWSDVPAGEPLFSSLLVFENIPVGAGSVVERTDVRYLQRSNYPLALLVMPGERLELIILYDNQRFDGGAVVRLAEHLITVLTSIPRYLSQPVGAVPHIPRSELEQVIVGFNATDAEVAHELLHHRIAAAAMRSPDRPAVVGGGISMTYAELMVAADVLGQRLAALGARPGTRVVIAIERSPAFVVAMLAAMRSGAAYVPVDPTQPAARTAFLLEDTDAALVVAREGFEAAGNATVVQIDDRGDAAGEAPGIAPGDNVEPGPDDPVYVLYTSGSTGSPKGVEVLHRNLANSTAARAMTYDEPVGAYLLLSPVIFDSSVAGIFWTLSDGGTLVMPGSQMEQDVAHLAELIASHGVTHTLALPSVYGLLLDHASPAALGSLRIVIVAGEACPPSLIDRHHELLPTAGLYNEYGPTEATVWATVDRVEPGQSQALRTSIGRPIANTQAYVLDGAMRPAPVGVPGELCLGGANVAKGYLGRPDLTAAAFVEADLPVRGRTRVYRSGDIASWQPDGKLDLLGRADHQVKVRGQRIELGEIEAALVARPGVREAVVVLSHGQVPRLVAYAEAPATPEDLRTHLAAQLPPAMVPAQIVTLDELPRGSTGKVDRTALPDPDVVRPQQEFVAPQGAAEQQLAAIWAEVLGIETVGATDNFFELGGDSILSIRVIARAHETGLGITPRQFFDSPTVAELAALAVFETS